MNLALFLMLRTIFWVSVFDVANQTVKERDRGVIERVRGRYRVREKQTVRERERGVIGRLRGRYRVREKLTVREREREYRGINVKEREGSYKKNYIKKYDNDV